MTPNYSLYFSVRSPFARRIRLVLQEYHIPVQNHVIDVFHPPASFAEKFPMGRVPALITPEGHSWYDSNTILELLSLRGLPIWPQNKDRAEAVRMAATHAVGLMESSVAYFLESQKPSPSLDWLKEHEQVTLALLDTIAQLTTISPNPYWNQELTQAGRDLGVALEYLSLRMPHCYPNPKIPKNSGLFKILDLCRENSFFIETSPPPATPPAAVSNGEAR